MKIPDAKPHLPTAPAPDPAQALRDRSEEQFKTRANLQPETLRPEEMLQVVHELRVHQIELELQNDELRQAEIEREAARVRFVDLYDFAPVGYMTLSAEGLILEANLTAATQLGVARSHLVKKHLTRFIVPEDQDIYYQFRNDLPQPTAQQTCEVRLVPTATLPFWARLEATEAAGREGGPPVYRIVISDITERKQAEAERQLLQAELAQAQKLESLGSLAGGVAHDMNNVLGAILSLASSLQENAEPSSALEKNFSTIVSACMRGRDVVKGLLHFAHKDLQKERPLDLNALVLEMTRLLRYTTLKRVQVETNLQAGLGLIRGDTGAISHALMNLCINALDVMPGGGTLHIQTATTPDGGVNLVVRDSGTGMGPDVLRRAMEPFFTTKLLGKGAGLGLAMVYGTMKAHDGTFELHSKVGHGTEAVLGFPASRVERATPPLEGLPTLTEAPHDFLDILLVDDDELIRDSLTAVLKHLGHRPVAAPGGREALGLLEVGLAVDLVILEMNMPGLSGAQTLPRLLARRPGLTVLMITGYSDIEIAPLLVGRPNVHGLRKPFSKNELQSKLASLGVRTSRMDASSEPPEEP